MFDFKYDGRMDETPAWQMPDADAADVDFDLERLNPQGRAAWAAAWLLAAVQRALLWVGLMLLPVVRIGKLALITRYHDVTAALANQATFRVHFNPEVRVFAGGRSSFMLALDGDDQRCQRQRIAGYFTDDVYAHYADMTGKLAHTLLAASGGRIDAHKDYFTRVSSQVGLAFLGLDWDDPDAFADWTIAMSNANFADFQGKPVARALASHAAWRQRAVVDQAIARARANPAAATGLLGHLIKPDVLDTDDDLIRSVIFGVSVALAPTITIGAGNMLAWLQRHPDALAQCTDAARAGDRVRLERCLIEAGRLSPALNPGQFRYAVADWAPSGSHGWPRVRAGDTVIVCTATALRDWRVFHRPGRFDPDRPNADRAMLMFGHASHYCLGDRLAVMMLVRLFEALLQQDGLRPATGRAGRLHRVGPFPRCQFVEFAIAGRPQGQSNIVCRLPLRRTADGRAQAELVNALRAQIDALGNPLRPELAAALDATGIIHFASLSLVDDPVPGHSDHSLILEVRADGEELPALEAVRTALGAGLAAILDGFGVPQGRRAAHLLDHRLTLTLWPRGVTGLHYEGSRAFSVWTRARQAKLARFATAAVDFFQRWSSGRPVRPLLVIQFVRHLLDGRPFDSKAAGLRQLTTNETNELQALQQQAATDQLADMLTVPGRQRLAFMDWRDRSNLDKGLGYLASAEARPAWIAAGAGFLLAAGLALVTLGPLAAIWWPKLAGALLIAVVTAVGMLLITAVAVLLLFLDRLRRAEAADRADGRDPDTELLRDVAMRENAPGFAQNHIIALSATKPGWFRRLTLSIALWGIAVLVRHWFRPGFVATMGTIHFASWARLPGSGALLFLANYDGSWNSYLEDFITKVPSGQTAAWTHAIGFPRTRWLIRDGVRDAAAFKRWVRRQQRPTGMWYARHRSLTLDRIRTHALIHDGLANAHSDTSARAWLANFGSAPATDALLESSEVQTIMFRSLPSRPHGALLLLSLPGDPARRRAVLESLLFGSQPNIPPISFGEMPPGGNIEGSVATLAFSAGGLGLWGLDKATGLPFAFTQGMAARARIIGDERLGADGNTHKAKLRWTDQSANNSPVHAVWQVIATTHADREAHINAVEQLLKDQGGTVVRVISTDPARNDGQDHFRFRDGLSQPAIRGTYGARDASAHNVLAPGEFLLGYPGNSGHVAPGIRVRIADDPDNLLPDVTVEPAQRYPAARRLAALSPAFRDFSRNGSFVVIRQLELDVDGFEKFAICAASALNSQHPGLATDVSAAITPEWLQGKLMGRWQDGVPLTARAGTSWRSAPPQSSPQPPAPPSRRFDDADMPFGTDDPRGLACPLGAHVRRANPRDSLLPDDPEARTVNNRHRILRRGRSYTEGDKKGLLFIGLVGDIERQFEFLQQRWINGPDFHGLDGETDPIAGWHPDGTNFSIPTVSGPVRLSKVPNFATPVGGGYFFLPSRAALHYLARL